MNIPSSSSVFRLDAEQIRPVIPALIACGLMAPLLFGADLLTSIVSAQDFHPGLEFTFPLISLAGLGLLIAIFSERTWVYCAVLAHGPMLIALEHEGIGINELVFIGISISGLIFWLLKALLVERRTLIRNGFDLLLIAAVVLTGAVGLIANILNEGDLLLYFKEYLIIFDLLLYFPIRSILTDEKQLKWLLIVFVIVSMINGVHSIFTYRERMAQAVFQWQILASRSRANEWMSMAQIYLSALYLSISKTWKGRIIALASLCCGFVFLMISFSRNPIISCFGGLVVILVMVRWPQRVRIIGGLVATAVIGIVVVLTAFPGLAKSFGTSVTSRLGSVANARQDLSFQSRLAETTRLVEYYVPASPVIGYGMGTGFHYRDPIIQATATPHFIHNGYLWLVFKVGIPVTILFYLMLGYPILKLMIKYPARSDTQNYAIMTGCVAFYISSAVMNISSNQHTQYSSSLIFVMCWVLLDWLNRTSAKQKPTA